MDILPAIDLKDGKPVRLFQGRFETVHQVAEDPLTQAKQFEEAGATWLHMVDLDGALKGSLQAADIILDIVKNTSLKVEVGGGIRTLADIDTYLQNGVERVILGSVALDNPALVQEAVKLYGGAIAVGIDAKEGLCRGGGWIQESKVPFLKLAKRMAEAGVKTIIYTDIDRDGMLIGPNVEHYQELRKALPDITLIASGGVRDVDDLEALSKVPVDGVICGKSLYGGSLDLKDALTYE